MRTSLEFLLGLLDRDEAAVVAWEDWMGAHGPALHLWQETGLIAKAPGVNPAASCPHCWEGVPFTAEGRLLCTRCGGEISPDELLAWPLNLGAFLGWAAREWRMRGGVRRIDAALWQLGMLQTPDGAVECFYRRAVASTDAGRARLAAFSRSLVLSCSALADAEIPDGSSILFLPGLVRPAPPLALDDLQAAMRFGRAVAFDAATGALRVGEASVGEVPLGSKEYHFLGFLAGRPDRLVPYADLKREVLRRSGGRDTRDEAGFCHRLKSRIKKAFIPDIDHYLVTANKGEGYRLRGRAATW